MEVLNCMYIRTFYVIGASPIYYAAQEGRLDVLEFMHEKCKCDLNKACNDGLKPIHAASQCGHTNIVKVGIDHRSAKPFTDSCFNG